MKNNFLTMFHQLKNAFRIFVLSEQISNKKCKITINKKTFQEEICNTYVNMTTVNSLQT